MLPVFGRDLKSWRLGPALAKAKVWQAWPWRGLAVSKTRINLERTFAVARNRNKLPGQNNLLDSIRRHEEGGPAAAARELANRGATDLC